MARDGGRAPLNVPGPVEDLLRELAPQVLGTLTRRSGDFAAAEDAVQEALVIAAGQWTRDGVPERPRGWLLQTATRQLIDQRRSDEARRRRERLAAQREPRPAEVPDEDDTLVLLFLCCHPSLPPTSAIGLTLRAVGGLSTAEIARAFLVPEATMAQRISRAKRTLKAAEEPFRMPRGPGWADRLGVVLQVLYLVFNEGYSGTSGPDVLRPEVSAEAIRLTRMLHGALPDVPEVQGLLALMLLVDARRPARTTATGELVPLAEQDRTRWDAGLVAEGLRLLEEVLSRAAAGPYQLQAAIAAVHDRAARAADTDWRQILVLYELLERMTGSPVVAINRAVAAAMADGPQAGLAILDGLDARAVGSHRYDAVRAHLLEMAGDVTGATAAYRAAAARTASLPEQRYLALRLARMSAGHRST